MKWFHRVAALCAILLLWGVSAELGDPYKILGLKRTATQKEIRTSYLKLAKEWHPDKSSDPSAGSKFVEIKQAYELLSDPDRRYKYDQKGITEENVNARQDYQFHVPNPFEELFAQHRPFNFKDNDITFFNKLAITTRQYDKLILPKSQHTPHLIFFYTDWCFPCLQTAPYIRKLVEYLEPLGISMVTVHSAREPSLARRMNVHSLPCLVLLLDGNVFVYKDSVTSLQMIIDFIRKKLPYNLVQRIQESDIEVFLNGWEDNRVRGLIFEPRENIRLRYLITAYHFKDRVAFGFVQSDEIRERYQVSDEMDTVLLFNENTSRPIASVSMKDIPTTTLHHIISSHQYLALPRLSSQGVLESLCPCEWNKPRKKLCVVLVTRASSSHDPHREAFRTYAQNSPYKSEKVRFAYIYHDKQSEFVNSLIPDGENVEPILRIVIIWRRDTSHIKYEWMTEKWESEDNINDTTQKLETQISKLLRTSEALTYEAFVKELFDEHAKGIFGRIITKLMMMTSSMYDSLDREQLLPALSVLGTIVFIGILGYVMSYLLKLEEENVMKQKAKMSKGNNNNDSMGVPASYQPELKLHELRAEKYNGLIRLLKPGCRTILLVLDMQSRQTLIPPFHKAVWPYRKNKTLMFSYMLVERGLSWYKELLELSLPDGRDLNIIPRNCVGTVLALNGHRKYFCMFHAKHTERNKKNKVENKPNIKKLDRDPEVGQFLGFDTESSESEAEEVPLQENLLDGLPNWLDRLFEGTTYRCHINYWPDFPNK